jgi:hypothetical protein
VTAGTVLFIQHGPMHAPGWMGPAFIVGVLAIAALLVGWRNSGR